MSGTITQEVTYAAKNINDNDTLAVTLTFEYEDDGAAGNSTTSQVGESNGMVIIDYGSIEWRFDLDDYLLVPGVLKIKLTDYDGLIEGWMFDDDHTELTIKVDYTLNGNTEFVGYARADSITYNKNDLTVNIEIVTEIDKINRANLYVPDDGEPSGYSSANPLALSMNTLYHFHTFIEKIFKLVDSTIDYSDGTLEIKHDLIASGERYDPADSNIVNDITFEELRVFSNPLFFDSDSNVMNCGAALRDIAAMWFAYTGLVHHERAFFIKLFYYDDSDLQTLGTVLSHKKTFKYGEIDYVAVTDEELGGTAAENGTYTDLDEFRYVKEAHIYDNYGYATASKIEFRAYLNRGDSDDGYYYIQPSGMKDPTAQSSFGLHRVYQADVHYYWRNKKHRMRVDEFVVKGVDYDLAKNFNYDGGKYQITRMKKDYSRNRTEIDAFYLGATS